MVAHQLNELANAPQLGPDALAGGRIEVRGEFHAARAAKG